MTLATRFRTAPLAAFEAATLRLALAFAATSIGCQSNEPAPAKVDEAERAATPHEEDHAHHGSHVRGDAELVIAAQPDPPIAGAPTTLRLMIHRPDGSMVQEFDILHEKKLHLILVREGLDEFAHLHPEVDDAGNAVVTHVFPLGGEYFVYADYQPSGERQSVAKGTLSVEGDDPPAPNLQADVPGRVSGDGLTADVAVEATGEGETRTISFTLHDTEGSPVSDLEPYLGALGHLVIISDDGREYVHSHPREHADATDGRVAFDVHFADPGLYKGWGQFQRAGEVLTKPFVVRVE